MILTRLVDVAYLLDDLEQPRSAARAKCFERGRNGKTDRLLGAAFVRYDKICVKRVKTALYTLYACIKRL